VDSRCRTWPIYPNGNNFCVDLMQTVRNIKRIEILQATIPVYTAATWQEEYKHVAIQIRGAYRRDVQQALPNQYASDTPALIPLATAGASAFVYTFYQQSSDAGLWKGDRDVNLPRMDRLEFTLLSMNPLTGAVLRYPLADNGFAVSQNWTVVVQIDSLVGLA